MMFPAEGCNTGGTSQTEELSNACCYS